MVLAFAKAVQYFSGTKCIPYKQVLDSSRIIILERPHFQQLGSNFNQLISWFQICFVLGSYWLNVSNYGKEMKLFELAMHTIWAFAFICVAAINVFMALEIDNVPKFFENIQKLQKHLTASLERATMDRSMYVLNLISKLMFMSFVNNVSCIVLLFLVFPTKPWYLFSYFPKWLQKRWTSYFFMALYELNAFQVPWGIFFIAGYMSLYYMKTSCTALKILIRERLPVNEKTALRRLRKIALHYRQLVYVNNEYSCIFGQILIPSIKVLFMLMCVVSKVGLIKLSGKNEIVVILYLSIFSKLSLAIVLVIVMFSACINHYSTVFINLLHKKTSWKLYNSPKLRREIKLLADSCNPIGIKINSFYTIKKSTVLNATGCIFNAVINVLLTV